MSAPDLDVAIDTMLRRLDAVLASAISSAQAGFGRPPDADPFRGLYVDEVDVRALLDRGPLGPAFRTDSLPPLAATDAEPFAHLAATLGLDQFELDVAVLALAPELDLRYERLFGFLQDDVTRRRPSVDLALTLLCHDRAERLARRAGFAGSPLIGSGLVGLEGDGPLLGRVLVPDEILVRRVLGAAALDPRLAGWARLIPPSSPPAAPVEAERLSGLRPPVRAVFCGPQGSGRERAAQAVAARLGVALVTCVPPPGDPGVAMAAAREALVRGAGVYVQDGPVELLGLALPLAVIGREDRCAAPGATTVSFPPPPTSLRRAVWAEALAGRGVPAGRLDMMATRYRLGLHQITAAADEAVAASRLRSPTARVTVAELARAARAQSGGRLGELALRVEPRRTWSDLILPHPQADQLLEICSWVKRRDRVLDEWGFDDHLSLGKGVTALFTGAAGTGKTLAAEIVANELDLDMYRIDLAAVVSKYIGETEKNLDRVFSAAGDTSAVLFFDEADALFGRRSEVRDSHDRYANIEISYLLQRMEQYEGLAILATNLADNLDPAFLRRLAFRITFPLPEPDERAQIWHGIWPAETPVSDEVDFDGLAAHHQLSGGQIKNVALAAAYLAAADGAVCEAHIQHALHAEYAKSGGEIEVEAPA